MVFEFRASLNEDRFYPANDTKIKNTYSKIMHSIQNSSDVPEFVRAETRRLLSSLQESFKTEPHNVSHNITAGDSNIFLGTGTTNISQSQPTEAIIQQGKEGGFDPLLNLVDPCGQENDEEDRIPSDLSIDHHPRRTCEYTFTFTNSDDEKEGAEEVEEEYVTESEDTLDSKWMVDGVSISDSCFEVKKASLKLVKRTDPAQLSDIRLLALNDIYIFDRNFTFSVIFLN